MQSSVCNRCPIWAKCCLTYNSKAFHKAAAEAGFIVKPTNYERIKDMSLDELAVFIRQIRTDTFGQTIIDEKCMFTSNDVCEWLESEVDTE